MSPKNDESFCSAFHVRRIERCCGTCRYFDRQYEDSGCANPRQAEFDDEVKWRRAHGMDIIPDSYGAYGGILVDEGEICDLWEAKPDAKERK